MVIKDLKKELISLLGARDAQLLITQKLKLSITDYALSENTEIDKAVYEEILNCVRRILSGEPLQYVVGSTEFMSLEFYVAPGVLIPRPDTECLVELAIGCIGDKCCSVLDIGTGSGCVAVSIAKYCKNSSVTSIDISDAALKIAETNVKNNKVSVKLLNCDIMNSFPVSKFDYIVSNPPYIPTKVIAELDTNVKDFEPVTALDGGSDGLDFYRRIIDIAPLMLTPQGMLLLEVGHDQSESVSKLMKNTFSDVTITKDFCGINRVVSGRIF